MMLQHLLRSLPWLLVLSAACQPSPPTRDVETKASLGSCCEGKDPGLAAALPETSLYQLEATFSDQTGKERALGSFRGQVTVVAMIFTHCAFACPRILLDLQSIEQELSKESLAQVHWLLISMDAERDTPAVLARYAEKNALDPARWTLLHGAADAVRETAAALGVRYKKAPDGNFAHSNVITILDREGRISERLEGLGVPSKDGALAIQTTLSVPQVSPTAQRP